MPSAPSVCHIFLVPGFFGFADLGDVRYFRHVERVLRRLYVERGCEARLHVVRVPPTGSMVRRAAALAEQIAVADPRVPDVHVIGHSTGGLDARLLCAPGVELPTDISLEPVKGRVRSVVCVSSPHRGTPMAAWFTNNLGQKLLRIVSAATIQVIGFGRLPIKPMLKLIEALRVGGDLAGLDGGLLDSIYQDILRDFGPERREQVARFFAEVSADTALMAQLSPAAMDLFGSQVTARSGVRYGSVVTRARPPSLRTTFRAGLRPGVQATYVLFRLLHRLNRRWSPTDVPVDTIQRRALEAAYGDLPNPRANDAIVPTLSQVHGRLIRAVWADHLDVIGHFAGGHLRPPHHDWLHSRSHFDRQTFESLWRDVVDFTLGARRHSDPPKAASPV